MGLPVSGPKAVMRMQHLGRTSQPRQFYASISVMLVPSIVGEGFPRVALEAMSNGIPVVASRIGGLPEAVEGAGILLDVDEDRAKMAEGFAQAIEHLFSHEAEFQNLSTRSLRRAERYDHFQKEQAEEHVEMLMRESTAVHDGNTEHPQHL
ncbi:MAG: glycosyltransferase family 4 protein [candidate division WOR-3 bacterium]|nr:glycosyltransferase family 4 protein [candidate division WOR-3 bacterium]